MSQKQEDNPFQQMDPAKQQFIASMVSQAKSKRKEELMPFLLTVTMRANQAGIQFTDEETDYIVKSMSAHMSPADRKKIGALRKMADQLSKKR